MLVLSVRFEGGEDLSDVAAQMCALSSALGCGVETDFNGRDLLVRPGDEPGIVEAQFEASGKKGAM